MRQDKAEQLIQIAYDMQASAEGITITDIMEKYDVARRTAERLRDAVRRLFPDVEEIVEGRDKRWRLKSSPLMRLTYISADELADLQNAVELMEKEKIPSTNIESLITKIKGINDTRASMRVETDLEVLSESDEYANRAGPAPTIDENIVLPIKEAILGFNKIKISYNSRMKKQKETRTLHPYGFLYGQRHYLVAWCEKSKDYRNFALGNIKKIENTGEYFERNEDFDLAKYTENSFGIFQEEPFTVKWKFSPDKQDDVKSYQFHPNQTIETLKDGSTIVSFTAGGTLEMCWHLFEWGNDVEILEPQSLKAEYKRILLDVLGHQE